MISKDIPRVRETDCDKLPDPAVRVVPVCVRQPGAGPAHRHHGLQDLQERPRRRQQGRGGTPVQGKKE